MSNNTEHTEQTEDIDPHDLEAIYNAANPDDEFIVKIDFEYSDVSYNGYQILSEEELGKLLDGLRSGAQIGTPNMPGSWYEDFDISDLEGAFTIHSSDPDDVKAMRSIFGESVGETSYFGLVFDAFDETLNSDDDSGSEKESPDHIDLGVAERFLENPDEVGLYDASTIDDDAAEVLAKHQGMLNLRGLTELSDAAAEALSRHHGELSLSFLTELSDAAAETLSMHQGWLNLSGLTDLSDFVAEALSKHQGGLILDGLRELSDTSAEALAKHQGELKLRGLSELSDRGADCFSAHNGWIALNGLSELTPAIARLMSSKAMNEDDEISCDFDRLETISPEVAGILGRGKYYMLCLDRMNDLSPDAARGLGEFEGAYLGFTGFSSLSAELARVLAQAKARTLSLGVEELNDEACEALSTFQGELALESLQTVSPTGASWLLKQGRCLEFCSLDLESIANGEK